MGNDIPKGGYRMHKLLLLLTAAGMLAASGCAVAIMPPRRAEVIVACPYHGAIWVPGYWKWVWWRHGYVWRGGFWRVHRNGRVFMYR